jgi:hypothetical protein
VVGRVLTAAGAPVPGAWVVARLPTGRGTVLRADRRGSFRVAVPVRTRGSLRLAAAGRVTATVRLAPVPARRS